MRCMWRMRCMNGCMLIPQPHLRRVAADAEAHIKGRQRGRLLRLLRATAGAAFGAAAAGVATAQRRASPGGMLRVMEADEDAVTLLVQRGRRERICGRPQRGQLLPAKCVRLAHCRHTQVRRGRVVGGPPKDRFHGQIIQDHFLGTPFGYLLAASLQQEITTRTILSATCSCKEGASREAARTSNWCRSNSSRL